MRFIALFTLGLTLAACGSESTTESDTAGETAAEASPASSTPPVDGDSLDAVLAAQPEEVRARYAHRHPKETLEFFGVEPGMTVLEGLPGGGWYTKILLDYLGPDGHLLAVDYSLDMYPYFAFASEEFMAERRAWTGTWQAQTADWGGDTRATTEAYHFGAVPEQLDGTVDVAIMVRALHHLNRFQAEGKGDYFDVALADLHRVLKPGGVLGVVQHAVSDDTPDEAATGSRGYLKQSTVVAAAEAAGFELVEESAINENAADAPGLEDVVWRLPPSLGTSSADPALREQMQAIGESNRMTLKFRKPVE